MINQKCLLWITLLLFSTIISLGLSSLATSQSLEFPNNYQQDFMHYVSVACPNSQIVRQIYANSVAVNAARANKSLPDGSIVVMETYSASSSADGKLTPIRLNNIFIREKRANFGKEHSNNLRNGNWQYAWFSSIGSL